MDSPVLASNAAIAARRALLAGLGGGGPLEAGFDDVLALNPSEALLDVGCGDGAFLAGLHASGHDGRLVGVDIEPELIVAARGRGSAVYGRGAAGRHERDPGPSVEFMTADAAHLPFPDASFDAVTARYVIDHLADPVAAIAEARRVIRPGGRLVRIANAEGHLAEFWDLVPVVAPAAGVPLEARFVELAAPHFDAVSVSYLSRIVVLLDAAVAVSLLDTHRMALSAVDDAEWAAARSGLMRPGSRQHPAFPVRVTLRLCVVRADVHAPDSRS